ncbi:hypothetical protein MPSEU_000068000 [Mayamaea pseudoterrestris]|nr:hypothetical protein MPSEU_000068000 [Mayamaea pseudoterrestris]
MSTFIPYQVDYSVKNAAKTLGFSKKKILFKFGFANPQACRDGSTGAQCRGSEHELTFVWSLASGKRNLFVDGKEVHYSESGMNGWTQDRSWQHVFSLKEGNDKYRVHFITQPKQPEFPDVKPFDLRVNGVSYFQFNRIFELGTPRMQVRDVEPRGGQRQHGGGRDSPMSPEERKAIATAKVESLKELRDQQIRKTGSHDSGNRSSSQQQAPMVREENLLNFDEPVVNQAPLLQQQMVPAFGGQQQFTSSLSIDSAFDSQRLQSQGSFHNAYGQPQQQQPQQQQQLSYEQPYSAGGGMYGQAQPAATSPSYGQQTAQAGYGNMYGQQQQAPPASYDAYGQQQAFGQQPPTQAFGQAPNGSFTGQPDATGNVGALTPYQPTAGAPAPSAYAMNPPPPLQQQQYGGGGPMYNSTGNFQQALQSPSAQSYASYGSAPSFAQPPQQQQQHQPPQQPAQNPAMSYYGQQPPSPQTPFGAPPAPQYAQQSSFGF